MKVEARLGRQPWRRLKPRITAELEIDAEVLARAVVAEVRETALWGPLDDATAANLEIGARTAIERFLAEAGDPAADADRSLFHAHGRAQYDAARSLEEMLAFYQLGGIVIWRHLARLGSEGRLPAAALGALGEAVFSYVADLSAAAADGYGEARSDAARAGQAKRSRLLELLLREPPPARATVAEAASAADWQPPARIAVAVARAAAAPRMLDGLPGRVLAGEHEGRLCAVLPADELDWYLERLRAAIGDDIAGLGPVVATERAALSSRRAAAILELALTGAVPRAPVVAAAGHELDLLLGADRELADEIARTRLAPLLELPADARVRLTDTLAAWLAQPDQPQAIANRLHIHVQTVRYRLRQLRELFDGALDDPERRFELAVALRVHRRISA